MKLRSHHTAWFATNIQTARAFFEWLGFFITEKGENYFLYGEGCEVIQLSLSEGENFTKGHLAFMVDDPTASAKEIMGWATENGISGCEYFSVNDNRIMVSLPFLCFNMEMILPDGKAFIKNFTIPVQDMDSAIRIFTEVFRFVRGEDIFLDDGHVCCLKLPRQDPMELKLADFQSNNFSIVVKDPGKIIAKIREIDPSTRIDALHEKDNYRVSVPSAGIKINLIKE